MATIITVHGTNATGPEYGNRWWQRGSSFENHLRELIEGKDGTLTFQPLIWDGANSEASRRAAGSKLLALMKRLEEDGKYYCIIGHSHGGSVIANALMQGADKTNELSHLARWITIGTPFIAFSKSALLFTRLGELGKSTFVSLVTWFIMAGIFLSAVVPEIASKAAPLVAFQVYCVTLIILIIPLIAAYCVLRAIASRRFKMYRRKLIAYAQRDFGHKWIFLCHKNDEALQGLESLSNLKVNIFSRRFAVLPISFISIFVIPALVLVCSAFPNLVLAIFDAVTANRPTLQYFPGIIEQNGTLQGAGNDYMANMRFLFLLPAVLSIRMYSYLSNSDSLSMLGMIINFLILVPALIVLTSLLIISVIGVTAPLLSAVLSGVLNRVTWNQIRKSMFGSDVLGEYAINAHGCPAWAGRRFSFLPDELGSEISKLSNDAAARSLAKFRAAFEAAAFREAHEGGLRAFSEYVSWEELIHTCYFNVPRFRKLVAYIVSMAKGFEATEQLTHDSDYALVEKWCQQIRHDVPEEPSGEKADLTAGPAVA